MVLGGKGEEESVGRKGGEGEKVSGAFDELWSISRTSHTRFCSPEGLASSN